MINQKPQITNHKTSGFTLIEMVVVTGIVGILAVVLTSLLVMNLRAQSNIQAVHEAIQNVHGAVDVMWRTIRFTSLMPSQPGGPSMIVIRDPEGSRSITYSLSGGQLMETKTNPTESLPLTSSKVVIDRLEFVIQSAASLQPRVVIVLGLYARDHPRQRLDIQKTVSLRRIDL